MAVVLFLLLVTAAGCLGHLVLTAVGLEQADAWLGGRVLGLVLVAWPGWWWGSLGLPGWQWLSFVILIVGGIVGVVRLVTSGHWRAVLRAEAIFWSVSAVVLAMRWGRPQIIDTEKPMDLGIMASLLRATDFPPPDMWLAGETLPYYYWGSLTWSVPIRFSGLQPELAYNLVVAMVAGLAAALAWQIGSKLAGGSRWAGAVAAFFAVLAGTPDGLRQVLSGADPRFVDLWASSRQVEHTITEYPLFTTWLGDLHPHYLAFPLILAALLTALHAGRAGPKLSTVAVLVLLEGAVWAANPWAMPPTLVGVALLLFSGDGYWHWPVAAGRGWQRWLAAAGVAVTGWLAYAPFHLEFSPPFRGIGPVTAWTAPKDLLLYAGCLLVGPAVVAVQRLAADAGDAGSTARLARILTPLAATVVVAVTVGRISLVVLGAMLLVLLSGLLAREMDELRPALALAVLGLFMLAVPDVLFVRDSYGDDLHRMNTVFKSFIQAWLFLAVALPALLKRGLANRRVRDLVLMVMVVAALPHLVTALAGAWRSADHGLNGLAWMSAGDRALVQYLQQQPAGTTVVEATGNPYSHFGRLSSASGVPSYLGWANHELVWRGPEIIPETSRRAKIIEKIYTSPDPAIVRELAVGEGIDLIAVGDLERSTYSVGNLAAIRAAGQVELEHERSVLVRVDQGVAEVIELIEVSDE